MKNLKKVLALVLAVVMIMGTVAVASAKDYTDVKNTDKYADAIDVLSNLNILDGYKDGNFKPEGTLTRAEAAKLIAVVNNAKVTGVIKSGEAISALYENTQNYFVDCNDSWARPLINYCRIMGLADGMTATTYEPQRTLTGVQWLKLMLTTLGFDTAKEGYTGTGWDVNVLNRANEIGLTAGLADGWKGIKEITRGEAAQILFNALTKYLVEYGQKIKGYTNPTRNDKFYNSAFVSNEQVEKSDKMLGNTLGLSIVRMYDVFGRPGYKWADKNSGWSKFYMDAPVASFTTATTACDLLVAAGIAKTSTKPMTFEYYSNGTKVGTFTYEHTGRDCEKTSKVLCDAGALLQYFVDEDGTKIVTRVDTYLAKVKAVNDTSKHGNNGGSSTFVVYADGNDVQFNNLTMETTVAGLYTYAANSYILNHMSWMSVDANGKAADGKLIYTADTVVETSATTKESKTVRSGKALAAGQTNVPYFVDVMAAESKTQTVSGRTYNRYPAQLTVDGEKNTVAAQYRLTTGVNTVNFALAPKSLTFFRDQYNNLIGDVEPTTTKAYGVLDGIYWTTAGINYSDSQYAVAGLVKAGEESVTDIKAATHNGGALKGVTENNNYGVNGGGYGKVSDHTVSTVKANNVSYTSQAHKYGVVSYTVNADETYNLAEAGVELNNPEITATKPYIGTEPVTNANVYANEATVFTVKTLKADGSVEYKSYTGIKNVPTLKADAGNLTVVAVYSASKVATFVYVDATKAIFAGNTVIAFVCHSSATAANYQEYGVVYTYDNVFVDGVKTSIDVPATVLAGQAADQLFNGIGLWLLNFNADGKVVKVTPYNTNVNQMLTFAAYTDNMVLSSVNGNAGISYTNIDGAKIYFVYNDDVNVNMWYSVEVVEKTVDDVKNLPVGTRYFYTYTPGAEWVANAIYFFVPVD